MFFSTFLNYVTHWIRTTALLITSQALPPLGYACNIMQQLPTAICWKWQYVWERQSFWSIRLLIIDVLKMMMLWGPLSIRHGFWHPEIVQALGFQMHLDCRFVPPTRNYLVQPRCFTLDLFQYRIVTRFNWSNLIKNTIYFGLIFLVYSSYIGKFMSKASVPLKLLVCQVISKVRWDLERRKTILTCPNPDFQMKPSLCSIKNSF